MVRREVADRTEKEDEERRIGFGGEEGVEPVAEGGRGQPRPENIAVTAAEGGLRTGVGGEEMGRWEIGTDATQAGGKTAKREVRAVRRW